MQARYFHLGQVTLHVEKVVTQLDDDTNCGASSMVKLRYHSSHLEEQVISASGNINNTCFRPKQTIDGSYAEGGVTMGASL